MTMKKGKIYIDNSQLYLHLSPQYDLFGGNAGLPFYYNSEGYIR